MPEPPPSKPPEVNQAALKLSDQLSSGSYQFSLAMEDLAEALSLAHKARALFKGEQREDCDTAIDMLDGSGSRLSELDLEVPSADEISKDMDLYSKMRLKWIDDANDSRFEAREAMRFFGSRADFGKEPLRSASAAVQARAAKAVGRLSDAIEELGGTVDSDDP